MTPKEKAKELFEKYSCRVSDEFSIKQCALIAVDEILNNNCGCRTDETLATNSEIYCDGFYWNEVKTELNNL